MSDCIHLHLLSMECATNEEDWGMAGIVGGIHSAAYDPKQSQAQAHTPVTVGRSL